MAKIIERLAGKETGSFPVGAGELNPMLSPKVGVRFPKRVLKDTSFLSASVWERPVASEVGGGCPARLNASQYSGLEFQLFGK